MRSLILALPVAMLAATAFGGASSAAPLGPSGSALTPLPESQTTLVRYNDCHNRTHNHYVPEWGVSVPHHHVGRYCRPVRDENDMGGRYNYYDDRGYYDAPTFYFGFGDDQYYDRGDRRDHRRWRDRHDWN